MSGLNVGPEGRVNTTAAGSQYDVKVGALQDGGYVIVWAGNGPADPDGVYLQRYDTLGHKVGGQISVTAPYASGGQAQPDVVGLDDGGYAVVWWGNGSGDADGIYYQTYDSTGTAQLSGMVNTTTTNLQSTPTVSALAGGGFVVGWNSVNQADVSSGYDVYTQIINAAGVKVGGEVLVNAVTADTQATADIATLADGSYVATWTSYLQDGSSYGVYARHFSETGVALSAETQVNATTYNTQTAPQVIAMADGGYLIAWLGFVDGGAHVGQAFQRYDSNDQPVGSETPVFQTNTTYTYAPGITALSDGGFVTTWTVYNPAAPFAEVMLQRYDDAGNPIGPQITVNTYHAGYQITPQVAALDNGGFVVTWLSADEDGDQYGVYQKAFTNAASDSGNQLLFGTSGADMLDGGSGSDTMYGGVGDDSYVVGSAGDIVSEQLGQGNDTVISAISYTLGANVENLTLTGSSPTTGGGNGLDNVIIGNNGSNILYGSGGIDYLYGGNGSDTYSAALFGSAVTINLATGKAIHGMDKTFLDGIENATGSGYGDMLLGNSGDNVLAGGLGADSMAGSLGDDTYYVDDAGDTVTESSNATSGGDDTVISSISFTLGGYIEDLILSGTGDINGNGNTLDNTIIGTSGINLIDGKGGADVMTGAAGDDTYWVDDAGDAVVEAAAEGTDTVRAGIDYILGQYVENLVLTGTGNFVGTGNASVNLITGNAGNNTLNGLAGADTMTGGKGDDVYYVDDSGDVVVEADTEGTDTIYATVTYTLSGRFVETLWLTGAAAINATGNSKVNTLISNNGHNVLTGGGGADTFVFFPGSGADTIADFNAAQADSINVHAYTNGTANNSLITQVGGDVHIDFGSGNVITVSAATVANVTAHMVW